MFEKHRHALHRALLVALSLSMLAPIGHAAEPAAETAGGKSIAADEETLLACKIYGVGMAMYAERRKLGFAKADAIRDAGENFDRMAIESERDKRIKAMIDANLGAMADEIYDHPAISDETALAVAPYYCAMKLKGGVMPAHTALYMEGAYQCQQDYPLPTRHLHLNYLPDVVEGFYRCMGNVQQRFSTAVAETP